MGELEYFPIKYLLKYMDHRISINRLNHDLLVNTLRFEEKNEVEMDYFYLQVERKKIEQMIQTYPDYVEKGVPFKVTQEYLEYLHQVILTTHELDPEYTNFGDTSIQKYGKESIWGVRAEIRGEIYRIINDAKNNRIPDVLLSQQVVRINKRPPG
jgi:hypothetical protein